jgi:hypothetical protein
MSSPALAQWNTQSPYPTHLDVRGVAAPTASRVCIATSDDSFDNDGGLRFTGTLPELLLEQPPRVRRLPDGLLRLRDGLRHPDHRLRRELVADLERLGRNAESWTAGYQGYIEHFTGPPPPPANQPPGASFDFAPTGLSVLFTDESVDPDGVIVSWEWDFGDSTGSTEQNPSHTYALEGTYIVRLTVTDDDLETGSAVRFVVVQPGPGGTFGDFTEVTPLDPFFVTPQDEDFWVTTTAPADHDGDGDLDIAVLGFYVVYNVSAVDQLVLLRNIGPSGAGAGPTSWDFEYIDVPLGELTSGASDLAWGRRGRRRRFRLGRRNGRSDRDLSQRRRHARVERYDPARVLGGQ